MANAVDVIRVQDLLPDDADWDEAKIVTYLDAEGATVFTVMQGFWEGRSAKLYQAIDVSESGSSRALSKVYDNAVKMAEYWTQRIKDEEEAAVEEEAKADNYTRLHKITRV